MDGTNEGTRTETERTPGDGGQDAAAILEALRKERELREKTAKEVAELRRYREDKEREAAEREQQELSEAERLRKALEDQQRVLKETDANARTLRVKVEELLIRHAVEREAAKLGFEYPDIAYSLIERGQIGVDEEDRVDAAKVKTALERILRDKPNLARAGARGGTPTRDQSARMGVERRDSDRRDSDRNDRRELSLEDELRARHNLA